MTDAEKIYNNYLREVNTIIKAIQNKLNIYYSINWGNVDDINYIYQNLMNIKGFLNVK